jgi:hypothetical protein
VASDASRDPEASKDELGLQKWVVMTSSKCTNFNSLRCDSCGEFITTIEGGWVEWLASESDRGQEIFRGLQLVHRGSIQPNGRRQACRYDSLKEFRNGKTIVEGLPLERFVGPDGLIMLFSFLAVGNLPQGEILELAKTGTNSWL